MNKIEDYARRGEQHDIMDALKLITKAYISQCGVSLGYRTILYVAGEAWLERLAWQELPLSEMARKEPLVNIMPHITADYDPERYDKYDIAGMSEEELLDGCEKMIDENLFDDATQEVVCWGIMKATEEREDMSIEIETVAPDGTCLQGTLTKQRLGWTSLTMTAPYGDLYAQKAELVRDARVLLVEAYEDYNRMRSMEKEIRALYPKYQAELRKHKNDSAWKKDHVFDVVYGGITGNALPASQKFLHEWYGLEFYDSFDRIDPSWL